MTDSLPQGKLTSEIKDVTRWKCVGYCRHCTADDDQSTFVREWGHFEKSDDGVWVRADSALAEIERLRAVLDEAIEFIAQDWPGLAENMRRKHLPAETGVKP